MYSCSHVVITVRDHTDCKYCLCMYIHGANMRVMMMELNIHEMKKVYIYTAHNQMERKNNSNKPLELLDPKKGWISGRTQCN